MSDDSSEAYVSSYQSDTDTQNEETKFLIENFKEDSTGLTNHTEPLINFDEPHIPLITSQETIKRAYTGNQTSFEQNTRSTFSGSNMASHFNTQSFSEGQKSNTLE